MILLMLHVHCFYLMSQKSTTQERSQAPRSDSLEDRSGSVSSLEEEACLFNTNTDEVTTVISNRKQLFT